MDNLIKYKILNNLQQNKLPTKELLENYYSLIDETEYPLQKLTKLISETTYNFNSVEERFSLFQRLYILHKQVINENLSDLDNLISFFIVVLSYHNNFPKEDIFILIEEYNSFDFNKVPNTQYWLNIIYFIKFSIFQIKNENLIYDKELTNELIKLYEKIDKPFIF